MIDPVRLHALADGELTTEEAQALREQILASEESSKELNAIYNLKDCVREKAQVFTCEVTFAASMKRVAELDRKRNVDQFVTRYAWGISGAFLALIAIGGVVNRSVSANHVQSSEIATMALLSTPDRKAAAPPGYDRWLDGMLQQSKASTDPNRLQVRGWAFGDIDGRRVTKVILRDLNGDMALLVIPGNVTPDGTSDGTANGAYVSAKINGMNSVARNDGTRCLILIADRPYDQLTQTLSHIQLNNP